MTICGRSDSGTDADDLADQLEAGHARHQVVDDEQVERALAELPLRLARARRLDDLVPFVAQRAAEPLEDLLLVVGEQDGAADASCDGLRRVSGRSMPDLGAFAEPAGDGERAAEAFDDVLGDRQAESGAGAPRREVRVEDVRHVVRR